MDFLRRYVFYNLGLKLVSLLAATLLWMAIAREPTTEVVINAPIEFHNSPDSLEISTEEISHVQVRVRGAAGIVRGLDQNDVHVVIDLLGVTPGEHTYDLTPRVRVPRDADVAQVIPSQVRLSFDTRATRQVEVEPRVFGNPASGFRLVSVKTDPATVMIVGPEKRVQAIESVITDPVDASGVMGHANFVTHVYLADPLVRLANPATSIHVTVTTDAKGHGR